MLKLDTICRQELFCTLILAKGGHTAVKKIYCFQNLYMYIDNSYPLSVVMGGPLIYEHVLIIKQRSKAFIKLQNYFPLYINWSLDLLALLLIFPNHIYIHLFFLC